MTSPVLWTLIACQLALGLFDIVFHHELTERLAWRPSQQHELKLHGVRNVLYAALFIVLGWFEPHGIAVDSKGRIYVLLQDAINVYSAGSNGAAARRRSQAAFAGGGADSRAAW